MECKIVTEKVMKELELEACPADSQLVSSCTVIFGFDSGSSSSDDVSSNNGSDLSYFDVHSSNNGSSYSSDSSNQRDDEFAKQNGASNYGNNLFEAGVSGLTGTRSGSPSNNVCTTLNSVPNVPIPRSGSFQCETCSKLFTFSRNLSAHKRMHSGERPFECSTCGKTFTDPSNFNRHMKSHQGLRNHQCDICNNTFTRLTSLERHNLRAHGLPKESKTKSQNKKHTNTAKQRVVTPLNSRSLTCEVCGKESNDASSLQRHRTIHFIKPHVCRTCGKCFHHEDGLQSHAKHHLLVKPFNCDACGKGFTERRFLTRHLKIHSGIKPHVCDICGKGFVRACSLKTHERIHLAKKQFTCELCDKQFSSFTKHKRTCAGLKSLTCEARKTN